MALQVDAVFEAPWFEGRIPWPWDIARTPPFAWIRMDATATGGTVGSFLARLVTYNSIPFDRGVAHMLRQLLREPDLVMPGGLRIMTGGTEPVVPGCCCGLENWREWLDLLASGARPWLGHDPWPAVEVVGDRVRVWPDVGSDSDRGQPAAEFEISTLLPALKGVRKDLCGFLERVRDWLCNHEHAYSGPVTKHLDEAFAISDPVEIGPTGSRLTGR